MFCGEVTLVKSKGLSFQIFISLTVIYSARHSGIKRPIFEMGPPSQLSATESRSTARAGKSIMSILEQKNIFLLVDFDILKEGKGILQP